MPRTLVVIFIALAANAGVLAAEDSAPAVRLVTIDAIAKDKSVLPQSGAISTGQPDAAVLETVAQAGYVAVVDLRTDEEDRGFDEVTVIRDLGMEYVSFPIASKDEINFENAARLDSILAEFDGPVMVHCGSGNRVGALIALRESNKGASTEDAIAAGKTAGMTRLEPVVRERLQEK
jgi:uncharacterized protein (TIGR01244 family)